ncbi:helix-turn-helix transcriptional regulator [Pendulispora rubella]|uniref:Helix-turn-helix transcriptional regulator n=1 Tax=Pendulispora rubella TaxID=2741070 RepID=A0ABZ2KY05_9BACT
MQRTFDQNLRLIFDQMPGFWGCKDDESVFMYANELYGQLMGLPHHLDVIGRTDFDMPCDTVVCAESFRAQDRQVLQARQPMNILDVHRFAGGEWKAFIVTKVPLYDENGDVAGSIFHGRDITSPSTIELGTLLGRIHADASFAGALDQGSYLLDDSREVDSLTKRESEVLFFLIRGKSAKEIANLLSLSYRTVEQYVDAIKSKFDAHSKSDLIEAAISRGYMHRIPHSLFSRQLSVALRPG